MAVTTSLTDSPLHKSIPLVIPDDMQYDWQSNSLRKIPDSTRKSLKIVNEAVQLLNKIKKPAAVLSITGPYRSGKSYILSRFLGSQDAFQLGHTMNAKTFGIWMATSVIESDDHVIILLDSEGIDAATSSEECDASILVLTILLSSHFIYNSLSVPRKQDLDKMSMFLQLASNIVVKDGQENDVNSLRNYFPDFLWLLRDVHLLPTDEHGTQISPTEYLKSKVLVRGRGFFESQADTVARALIAFFPSIECRTLPPPSTDPQVMRDIANKSDELSPDFNDKVIELLRYVKGAIKIKKGFTGGSVTGPILAYLTKEYVSALNSPGAIPTISNAWKATALIHQQEVVSNLLLEYEMNLKEEIANVGGFPLEEESTVDTDSNTLMNIHQKVLSQKVTKLIQAVTVFSSPGDVEVLVKRLENGVVNYDHKPVSDDNGQEWQKNIVTGGVLYKFTTSNNQKSKEFCENLINRLYKPINDKINGCDPDYTFRDLLSDLANFQSRYFTEAKGPAKWEVYERKKKDSEADKEKFTQLKDYEAEVHRAAEEAEKFTQQSVKMAEQMNTLRSQVLRENDIHKVTLEEIKASHELAVQRMEKEHQERQRQEEAKYEEFKKAQMEDMMKAMEESKHEREEQKHEMLEMMQQQMDACRQSIEQITIAAQKAPPPPKSTKTALLNMAIDKIPFVVPFVDKCKLQ